jgi:hypothetical protein
MNEFMTTRYWLIIGLAGLCAAGCASQRRSISNSGFTGESRGGTHRPASEHAGPFGYRGEVNEFDLLGVDLNEFRTEEEIQSALRDVDGLVLSSGAMVMLIQSGAMFPDAEMVQAMEKHFQVVPFSGVPPAGMRGDTADGNRPRYARTFRWAAARAGAEYIVCYWGMLESMREDLHTKSISWVPVVGWVIPDEDQAMRLRLKLAVIDVATGEWTLIVPESPVDRHGWSNRYSRARSDQKQVQSLKEEAYKQGVDRLLDEHAGG